MQQALDEADLAFPPMAVVRLTSKDLMVVDGFRRNCAR
jgi:hypothetical protein